MIVKVICILVMELMNPIMRLFCNPNFMNSTLTFPTTRRNEWNFDCYAWNTLSCLQITVVTVSPVRMFQKGTH